MGNTKDIDLFKNIFELSVNGILVVDLEGVIMKANPASERLFGYESGELMHQKVENCIPNKFKNKRQNTKERNYNSHKEKRLEEGLYLFGYRADGSKFPLEISLTNTTIAGEQVIIAFITDITAHEKIEKKLKSTQSQLQIYSLELEQKVASRTSELTAAVEKLVASNLSLEDQIEETEDAKKSVIASKSLSSAIAKNFPNGFIIVFNANFEMLLIEGETVALLGLGEKSIEETTMDDIRMFSATQKVKLKQDILKTIAGAHLGFEITYKNKYFSVNTIPLADKNAFISSALFVYSNITEQKKVEQDSQNALKKEQELNELKSRFVAMASHEFRTPLSAIQTSAILIGRQNESGKEQKREKYVAQIKRNVKQLVVILNDFLSLSKLEEGKVTANKVTFDFVVLSKTLVEEVSMTKKIGKNIIISAPDAPVLLNLDPKLVRRILMNLLSNAIKYSPENTDIHIKIEKCNQFISLEVQNQGIGIPEEEQDKLFERFFRAKNVQDIEGTGLGLHIIKQFVALMNGTIDFKSKANKGATFLVKLPMPSKI
ncbi:MAG: PAS domain S-box-containing protein [Polaribacter sp.]|jgi:PAS domain S-box-containing protein|tara:strand:- start:6193 stop:7830 length:1638 start_codon:yes stop_codon:yes gene_type:complete